MPCRCQISNVPICLVYGKEDPWVKPIWGRQVKRQMPDVPYYEISPAGHCPHDEVPEVCALSFVQPLSIPRHVPNCVFPSLAA